MAACDGASLLRTERGADETLIAESQIAASQGVPSEASSDPHRFADMTVGESRDSCIDFMVDAIDGLDGEGHGLTNPIGAEVHLVVCSQGPRIPGMVREQRSTLAGGCESFLGAGEPAEAPGDCPDLQLAVFP